MNNDDLENKVITKDQNQKPKKQKGKKSYIRYFLNISFVLIATGLAIFLSVRPNAAQIWDNLMHADVKYLLIVLGLMLGCILVRSFILFCFAHLFTRKYHFHQAMAVDQIGVFYNAITPGANGGQILQAYTYKKQGVQISSAVSILAMYSIVYQTVLIIFGLISIIMKHEFITSVGFIRTTITINEVPLDLPIWPLTIIGFLLNVSFIGIIFLMSYWHGFHNFIMGPVVSLLHKIKLVKNPDRTRENLRIQVENFKIEFRRLNTNIPFLILVIIFFVGYFFLMFSVPYFVGEALGNQSPSKSLWDCIFLSNYHQMITGLIPIPGGAGVSEFVFYNLFINEKNLESGFFCVFVDGVTDISASQSLCRSALLLWRSATFIIPIFIGGFVAAFYHASPKNEIRLAGDIPNRQTFVSLQRETYIERYKEVESLVETSRLSRDAIFEKLGLKKKHDKSKDNHNDISPNIEQQDYDEIELDDLEDK